MTRGRLAAVGGLVVLLTAAATAVAAPVRVLWPPVAALLVIVVTRHALVGLLVGGVAGGVMLAGGHPLAAATGLVVDHLAPSLRSPWKLGAIAFTLLLGGFAAVLERSGGFARLVRRAVRTDADAPRAIETAAAGLGLLCFFDGLANSMVVGRVCRDLGDRHGVARVKLAYITDSTSSAVACVALLSTWIAFQLTLIHDAFAQAGYAVNPYTIFLASLPDNFYCWFTLVLLFASIRARYHPGPMGACVRAAQPHATVAGDASGMDGPVRAALIPLAALMVAFVAGFVALGSPRPVWPPTRAKLVAAFGSDAGPLVLVLAAVAATMVALVLFPRTRGLRVATRAFGSGVATMVLPIFILIAAWMLGSVMDRLGTAALIARLATDTTSLALLPTLTFVTGAAISFATGTSWGTMGLLFPLAVPAGAALGGDVNHLTTIVAAVFSGAVFGDHCSPFSDTTIVTAISCGVEPHDHVRTQIPYALITAAVAVVCGFLPVGFGLPGWAGLGAGSLLLVGIATR